ncbi:MAG TPA: transglycosylase SLT domain-containing protein, partial [Solimonas sp.]|nr:transglycosylase SLT domain-containing protein [Solimonas sp.]
MKNPYICVYLRLSAEILLLGCLFTPVALAAPTERPNAELRQLLVEAVDAADSFEHRYDAEVWLLDMSARLRRFVADDAQRLALLRMIHGEAVRAKLAPELVLSVIDVESRFDRYAISSSGALGLMQIMPFWLDEIGKPGDNLFNARTNLRLGCTILKYYLEKEKGNLFNA